MILKNMIKILMYLPKTKQKHSLNSIQYKFKETNNKILYLIYFF